jgi:hypothetical protein
VWHRKGSTRHLRMMRRQTWQESWPIAAVTFGIGLLVAITGVGLLRAALMVALPGLVLAAGVWALHARRVRAVCREADAGIRSLESWLEQRGRGRRS